MDKRLYPISIETFDTLVLPIIEESYIWKVRIPIISHYKVFCAILYVLSRGIPWRDLPKYFENWHSIFIRFQRGKNSVLFTKTKKLGLM